MELLVLTVPVCVTRAFVASLAMYYWPLLIIGVLSVYRTHMAWVKPRGHHVMHHARFVLLRVAQGDMLYTILAVHSQ